MNKSHVKILFELVRDDDGYPSDDFESLWAKPVVGDEYEIDNIPFFIQQISCGDIVKAIEANDELCFKSVFTKSKNSTLRVICFDLAEVENVRRNLASFGCSSELGHIEGLMAANVPEMCDYKVIKDYLDQKEQQDILEYEEASLRY